ncbi:hypothetical protein ACW0JT_23565 [Arthrobacter sp. SA17]
MSSDSREQQERRLDDERRVDALLAEGGFPDDAELRDVLLQLRSLRVDEVPPPSAELAALLGQPGAADVVHLDEWSRKHPRKKRVVFTTLAVAASLGAAGGAAAGNDTLRRQAEGTISSIVNSLSPDSGVAPSPASPSMGPAAPPAVVPAPAGTLPAATVPAGPSPVEVPTVAPSVEEGKDKSESPGRSSRSPQDRAAPPVVPPTGPGGKPAEPGASRESSVPSHPGQPAGGPPAGQSPAGGSDHGASDPASDGKAKDKAGPNDN